MIMCSKCKRRPAVVFITSVQGNEKKNEGFCLSCARANKIPQISEYMDRLGITDDEVDQLSDQMMSMLDGDSFEMGGSGLMPDFISNLFGMGNREEKENPKADNEPRKIPEKNKSEKRNFFGNKQEKKQKQLKYLSTYCTNLSQKASDGELDAIIGRDKEIARVVQILSRRTKNNPCLIGEPGVGKTAIAEGIAQRINSGDDLT